MAHPLDFIRHRHPPDDNAAPDGYAMLANVASVACAKEIVPGFVVRRATDAEIEELRHILDSYCSDALDTAHRNPFEVRIEKRVSAMQPVPPGPVPAYDLVPFTLPQAEWRYTVARYAGTNMFAHNLMAASCLTSTQIELGVEIGIAPWLGATAGFSSSFIRDAWDDEGFIHMTQENLDELADAYVRFMRHDESVLPLQRIVSNYVSLRRHPESDLRFLGYVALLEGLLTHDPDPKDPHESLTKQIVHKMALLSSRFKHPLSYEGFAIESPEKLWKALYALRSKIAHGAQPNFTSGPLVHLKSADQARRFIREATWRVMRHALDEPKLVADLQDC
jgi:hypothetical protein